MSILGKKEERNLECSKSGKCDIPAPSGRRCGEIQLCRGRADGKVFAVIKEAVYSERKGAGIRARETKPSKSPSGVGRAERGGSYASNLQPADRVRNGGLVLLVDTREDK